MLHKMLSQKKVWCCIAVVELLLLAVAGLLYRGRERVDYQFTQEELVDDTGAAGFYIDKSSDYSYVATPEVTLPRGMYTMEAQYEYKGEVRLEIYHTLGRFDDNAGGLIRIGEAGSVTCDFQVKYGDRPLHVLGRLAGDAADGDYLLLRSIRITSSPVGTRNFVFKIAALLLLADLLLALYALRDRFFADAGKNMQWKVLLLLVGFCSLPLAVNYLFDNAYDLGFHLTRIESIKDGLLNGVFPVKVPTIWMNGYGYASSVFYGDLLLYIPAVLRIFGISVLASYYCYVFLIHVLTVGISFHCFSKMSDRWTGLLCAALYSTNLYRLHCVYTRAAVGEYTAVAFMPLVLYGLWKVYKLPEDSKEHANSWITIAIGCSGIFLSHMISTEMTALFVIITVVILWKKTIRKKTLVVLLKAVVATLLVNLWFLLPFLDYMASGDYAINSMERYEPYLLEDKGGYLVQFFMTDYEAMELSGAIGNRGAAGSMPMTVGNAMMLILIGWFLLCVWDKGRDKSERKEEYLAVFLSVLCLFMTRYLFPYTWFARKIPFLQLPVHSLQYQWRFLAIAAVLLLWLLCMIMKKEWIERKKKIFFAGLLAFLAVSQGITFISKLMNDATAVRIYQEAGIDTDNIGFGEYIPVIGDATAFTVNSYQEEYREELTYDAESVTVEEWHRDKGDIFVRLQNGSQETQQVEVPFLLYKGYRAVTDSGEQLPVSPGNYARVSVAVPAGYAGTIQVGFREPWYWRVSEVISLLTVIGIVLYQTGWLKKKRAEK